MGVGLIGGSVGKALRARGLAKHVVGVGRDVARLETARRLGALDEGGTNATAALHNADVVIVCTPVPQVGHDVREAATRGPEHVLVMDVGSTKRSIVEEVERDPRAGRVFVGAHPLAGSERQGVEHSTADLFEGRVCVLTPTPNSDPERLPRAREFWAALGCELVEMTPAVHDQALALTSHLPHVTAAALAAAVPVSLLHLAAGAYRDGTRVAGADAALWAGILRDNRLSVLEALDQFEAVLREFRQALTSDDLLALTAWWQSARERRHAFDQLQSHASPDRAREPSP